MYLDSSAIVKRYVKEAGSDAITAVYKAADSSSTLITFSLWNIGEVLGTFDSYLKRKWINENQFATVLNSFAGETLRLAKLMMLEVAPLTFDLLSEAWKVVLHYHVYEADAVQIVAAKDLDADIFLSADRKLLEVAKKENMNAINVESEGEKLLRML